MLLSQHPFNSMALVHSGTHPTSPDASCWRIKWLQSSETHLSVQEVRAVVLPPSPPLGYFILLGFVLLLQGWCAYTPLDYSYDYYSQLRFVPLKIEFSTTIHHGIYAHSIVHYCSPISPWRCCYKSMRRNCEGAVLSQSEWPISGTVFGSTVTLQSLRVVWLLFKSLHVIEIATVSCAALITKCLTNVKCVISVNKLAGDVQPSIKYIYY